jgi:glycine cleavage system aminomethyltransferase T
MSRALHKPIALAYLRRDFTAQGTDVTLGGLAARVSDLPFPVDDRRSAVQEE